MFPVVAAAAEEAEAVGHGHGGDTHLEKSFMEMKQDEFFEYSLHTTNIIGSYILLFGIITSMINVFQLIIQHFIPSRKFKLVLGITQPNATSPLTLDQIKLELGRIVAFSLLLLVAADVLETLLKPMHHLSLEDLYKMALVGGIRTTLAYFLNKEIEEIIHHMNSHHNDHNDDHHHHDDETEEDESPPTKTKKKKSSNNNKQKKN